MAPLLSFGVRFSAFMKTLDLLKDLTPGQGCTPWEQLTLDPRQRAGHGRVASRFGLCRASLRSGQLHVGKTSGPVSS